MIASDAQPNHRWALPTVGDLGELVASGDAQEQLRAKLRSLGDSTGFQVASLGVLRATAEIEVIAVSDPSHVAEEVLGEMVPSADVAAMLAAAENWGGPRFLDHQLALAYAEDLWTADPDVPSDPARWHPYDLLMVPVVAGDSMLGVIWLDLPLDGLRPVAGDARTAIAVASREIARSIAMDLDRVLIEERERVLQSTRDVLADLTSDVPVEQMLRETQRLLATAFGAEEPSIVLHDATTAATPLQRLGTTLALRCWAERRAAVVSRRRGVGPMLDPDQHRLLTDEVARRGDASMMLVPVGAGPECLGRIVMWRGAGDRDWSDAETDAALEIGRDLGRAVLTARALSREKEASAYKQQLVAGAARELARPIRATRTHLAALNEMAGDTPAAGTALALRSMTRAADRLADIVSAMGALTYDGGSPARPHRDVDLAAIARDGVELNAVTAAIAEIDLTYTGPDTPVWVLGDGGELERMLANLVGNALKYTNAGGAVTVTLTTAEAVATLAVADTGLGISEVDQRSLFQEFFRSADPDASRLEGTGLGLAIVARIAERHSGSVAVESTLGVGSTFTVSLPRHRG
ncbi:cell wall metabolism sensor histidine kinase WalK [Nocardioides sp. R-C-SC26]|uniref:sensor histidine kinase n=1 Tax=Nocardioides sp. R-C-SC26 TaxID=2870414 RepID=UPI001E4C5284|nr:HAMP domain-containing sensor histidine kinase [Nocardioides sp. R-C-SC26]